jgi:hypothetical protein
VNLSGSGGSLDYTSIQADIVCPWLLCPNDTWVKLDNSIIATMIQTPVRLLKTAVLYLRSVIHDQLYMKRRTGVLLTETECTE